MTQLVPFYLGPLSIKINKCVSSNSVITADNFFVSKERLNMQNGAEVIHVHKTILFNVIRKVRNTNELKRN